MGLKLTPGIMENQKPVDRFQGPGKLTDCHLSQAISGCPCDQHIDQNTQAGLPVWPLTTAKSLPIYGVLTGAVLHGACYKSFWGHIPQFFVLK